MTEPALRIETERGIVYVSLSGDVDLSNVPEVRRQIGAAVSNQALGLVLDLSEVDYLDSAGMHLVHSLRADLRRHGQQLALVIPADSVINDALRLAGIGWEEQRIGSRAEAERRFAAATSGADSAAGP